MSARSIPMEEWKCDPSQIKEILDRFDVQSTFTVWQNAADDVFLMWRHGSTAKWVVLTKGKWTLRSHSGPILADRANPVWFANSYMPEDISPGLLPYIAMGV